MFCKYHDVYAYEDALELAKKNGDDTTKMVAAFEQYQKDPSVDHMIAVRAYVSPYHVPRKQKNYIWSALTSPFLGILFRKFSCFFYIARIQKYPQTNFLIMNIVKKLCVCSTKKQLQERFGIRMNRKQIRENKLGMILQFSIPSIIAMLLETIITITDGYFTGNYVGESALAAINLGLPILYFYLGVGLCVGVGGSVICGRLLGANDGKKASEVFSQTIVTALSVCIVTSVIVFLFFTPILKVLRADDSLAGYFTEYYRLMLFTYPLMVIGTTLGIFIRVDARPQFCMVVSIISCVVNIILDYVLVAVLGMGVQGSAIGSLLTQAFVVAAQLAYFGNSKAGIRFRKYSFDKKVNKEILLNGSSEFIGEMASAISMFAFNYVLMKYVGAEGVAAFTILGFAVYGYSMICIGFGQGITPLVSIVWGALDYETAMDIRKITNRILFVIGALIAAIFFAEGKSYASLFGCSKQVVDMVASGFKLYGITFLVMGYDVVNSMYFTSCGDAKSSALISSLRGIILLLAFTLILPAFLGMTGIWLAAPCTEALTAIVSMLLIKKQRKIMQKGETDGQEFSPQCSH